MSDPKDTNMDTVEKSSPGKTINIIISKFLQDTQGLNEEERFSHVDDWCQQVSELADNVSRLNVSAKDKLCIALTAKGGSCKNHAYDNSDYCRRHNPETQTIQRVKTVLTAKPCQFTITRGTKRGQLCGKNTPLNSDFCPSHSKTSMVRNSVKISDGEKTDSSSVLDPEEG